MSVSNGQVANATTFNNALVSKTATTGNTVTGIVEMANVSDVNSGIAFTNAQRYINEIADSDGTVGQADATRKTYSSTTTVANGDSRKVAVGKLDAQFHATTGHLHTGVAGEGSQLSALDALVEFNKYFAAYQAVDITSAAGPTFVVTSYFSSETPGGNTAVVGVVTSPPNNKCQILSTSTLTYIEDAGGQRVYAKITESAGVWTLSFFTNEAGTETAHSLSSQNITLRYLKVFDAETRPTFSADLGLYESLDLTADITDASATVSGKVNTTTQTFGGNKTFDGTVAVEGSQATFFTDRIHIRETETSDYWAGYNASSVIGVSNTINDALGVVLYGSTDTATAAVPTTAISLQSGSNTHATPTAPTGDVYVVSGGQSGTGAGGDTGSVFVYTGITGAGSSGSIEVITSLGSVNTGGITIQTGPATSGNSGTVNIVTGTAGGTRGYINVNANSVAVSKPLKTDASRNMITGDIVLTTEASSGAATNGQVATANGAGAITWTDVSVGFPTTAGAFTLVDNTASATTITTSSATTYKGLIVDYCITRGSNIRVGRFIVATDGTSTASYADQSTDISSVGVTFTGEYSGGNILWRYTTTSTGSNALLRYALQTIPTP